MDGWMGGGVIGVKENRGDRTGRKGRDGLRGGGRCGNDPNGGAGKKKKKKKKFHFINILLKDTNSNQN